MTEIFEYVFKQALGAVDELINLEPENQQLKFSRAALLQARPVLAPVPRPTGGALIGHCVCKECSETGETLPLPFEKEAELERDRALKSLKSGVTFLTRTELEEIKERSWANNTVLPLTGRWHTKNGTRAEITELRQDNVWVGFAAGHGETIWDLVGNNINPALSLKERIRPASKEAQGGDWVERTKKGTTVDWIRAGKSEG